jgi:hypothetical protein
MAVPVLAHRYSMRDCRARLSRDWRIVDLADAFCDERARRYHPANLAIPGLLCRPLDAHVRLQAGEHQFDT